MKKGYIYIMTNPAFPEYVKIGYSDNVERRLNELNRSSAVPKAYRIYATYEVDSELSDKKMHLILDKLNPDLRITDMVNGRKRKREFYDMSAEDVYSILEAIAEINGFKNRLMKYKLTEEERIDEKEAKLVERKHNDKRFSFRKAGIRVGEELEFYKGGNRGKKIVVVDEKNKVEYDGMSYTVTGLAKHFLGKKISDTGIAGPHYFKYKGEFLYKIMAKKSLGL